MLTIKPSNKKNFFKVYHNEELLGSVPKSLIPDVLFLEGPFSGQGGDAEYMSIIKDWVYKNALNKLIEYLSKMEKCVSDCKVYLKRHDVPDAVISKVIKEVQSKNWLSDERYAMLYTEEAILCGRSPLDIKHKLTQKKIDIKIIDKAIKEFYTDETKDDILENLIKALVKRYAGYGSEKLFEKAATALYRKGFQYNEYEDLLRKMIKTAT